MTDTMILDPTRFKLTRCMMYHDGICSAIGLYDNVHVYINVAYDKWQYDEVPEIIQYFHDNPQTLLNDNDEFNEFNCPIFFGRSCYDSHALTSEPEYESLCNMVINHPSQIKKLEERAMTWWCEITWERIYAVYTIPDTMIKSQTYDDKINVNSLQLLGYMENYLDNSDIIVFCCLYTCQITSLYISYIKYD